MSITDYKGASKLFTLFIFLILIFTLSIYLDMFQQAVLAYGLMAFGFLLIKIRKQKDYLRIFILSIGLFITLRYWIFRTFHTLGYTGFFDSLAMTSLYIAETYAIIIYLLGIFVNLNPIKRNPPPLPEDKKLLPSVDIFIPTYNEPEEIIRITAIACKQLRYPQDKLNIYILDDGATYQKRNEPREI